MPARSKRQATTIDEYLAGVGEVQRVTLEKLRKTIRSIVAKAEECISYGLAAFRLDGKLVAGLGAGLDHCAYYPMSGSTVASLKEDLKGYNTSKGAIRFPPNKALPVALVRKLIRARLAENAGPRRKAD
jgi:uncharacterized protein YdhG (YjbR/CyaY superfamily)